MATYLKLIILFMCSISMCSSLKFASLDKTYDRGVKAYNQERWSECIVQFEESLHLYKLYKSIIVNCRLKCKSHNFEPTIKESMEDLHIFEMFFNMRDCLTKCQTQGFNDVHIYGNVSDSVIDNLQTKKPYEYLHICYFQMYALPKAASAAYTYYLANPHEETMKNNVEYYVEQPEVDAKEVIDLESEDYKVLYQLGLKAYQQKKWGETVANLEESLTGYLTWENTCRAECERQPEQEASPEFAITISNYMASLLICRQKCQDELKPQYESGVQYLSDVLNYLQISYYHLDRIQDAAKTVSSFLKLLPTDEDMLENKLIYESLVDKDSFVERSDIAYYLKRDQYEKKLLNFFLQGNDNTDKTNTNEII
ncbi:cartilage-associated protein-like [Epargyreus clarus]|uniref:cartilage-associated protein-like n=1 Tax=Epargyreus clarus TaxID=520877 RepID=UPI003C2B4923